MVAARLREEIVRGSLQDGSKLANQDQLAAEFGVSKASLREAVRILETENLVSVRRGKFGGVLVHAPSADAAAYTLGLLLESQRVTSADFLQALDTIEPLCGRLCAARRDRRTQVVPALRKSVQRLEEVVYDERHLFSEAEQSFHDILVASCGNKSLSLLLGVLETLIAVQQHRLVDEAASHHLAPNTAAREHGLEAHRRILSLIEKGDPDEVAKAIVWHRQTSRSLRRLSYPDLICVTTPNAQPMAG
jgi:DNA-binding FadR family transcriptional regulator